jgi:DNA-binding MarR family transcriptional regulator
VTDTDQAGNRAAVAGHLETERPAIAQTVARFEAFQHRLMAAHAEEFATVDLTMAQAKLLYVVMAAGELTLSEIAGRLRVTPSTASGAVDHLVGLGLLARSDDPSNRRQIRVSITPLGTTTIEQISELGARQMTALFSVIADPDLEVVQRAIGILSDAVATLEAGAAANLPPPPPPKPPEADPKGPG